VSATLEHEPPDLATIAAYLSNRLDPSDAEAFELYCLRHPDFARQVELDLQFKRGLQQIHKTDRTRHTDRRRHILFALAACVALVVCGTLLLLPRGYPAELLAYRSMTEVPQTLLAGPRVSMTLIRVRDGTGAHTVAAPRGAGILAVRIAPDSAPGRMGYVVGIGPESTLMSQPTTLDDLHPDADGYINMYLPVAAVVGRTLRITVNPSPAAGTDALSFRLQVTYAENAPPQ
jgi:hypothetical protein